MSAFLPPPPALLLRGPSLSPRRRRRRRRRRPCRHAAPRLALSEPFRRPRDLRDLGDLPDAPTLPPSSPPRDAEYHGWSHDFVELCRSQLSLLASTVPSLSQVLLFFRNENPSTGALEFLPLVVHTAGAVDTSRVWIASADAAETELGPPHPSRSLPGGIPAQWLMPDYPFKSAGEGILMPDGGLCVPVEYNGVLAGGVVLCPLAGAEHQWTEADFERADIVAKSIALGAALEGKWHQNAWMLHSGRSLIDSMRGLLATTLHQVRSPVSALVTFGHLLLRKLPPGDPNRTLAKNVILEALRVNELLQPLDEAGDAHVLPEANGVPWYQKEEDEQPEESVVGVVPKHTGYGWAEEDGMQLIWLSDVLVAQAERSEFLAGECGMHFVAEIDDDSPPILAVEKHVRETVSSLIDNAIKYSPRGATIGIQSVWREEEEEEEEENEMVDVVVWDTGYGFSEDEIEEVWDFGFRGSAAVRSGAPGSGIGLSAVQRMLQSSGAEISLVSPLPENLDPRSPDSGERAMRPGSAFTMRFKRPSR